MNRAKSLDNFDVFGLGQITLENGDTHDVQVLTVSVNDECEEVAYVYDEALANKIVRAVNSHDALVEALKFCQRNVESQLYMLPVDASEEKDILSGWIGRINEALTLAKGEPKS